MNYEKFLGAVQSRARLPSNAEAVSAVRATLETLASRLTEDERKDLASQLPREIGAFLLREIPFVRLSLQEFFQRVSELEGIELPTAVYHARVVMEVLGEAVSPGEMEDVRAQLPEEFVPLFEGSKGTLRHAA
jgi:uncharacterized protein (DUF2267 family)